MRKTIAVAAFALWSAALPAQERWRQPAAEIRPFAGVFLPVGASEADFKSATMMGVQGAFELNRYVHAVANLGWTHGHNRMFTADLTHIWQYDVGAELNAVQPMGWDWYFRPFLGVGGGGRTYDYRGVAAKTTTCTAGYGSLGGELQRNVLAFRVEARDYLTCFESPLTGKKNTRNDIGLTFGVAYHVR